MMQVLLQMDAKVKQEIIQLCTAYLVLKKSPTTDNTIDLCKVLRLQHLDKLQRKLST